MTANGHQEDTDCIKRTPKGHQKDTIFSESTHITTHHDEPTVEHNSMSNDESGITRNATLEATLGIEPRYRALQALA